MDLPYDVRRGEIHLVVAAVDEDAFVIEHGSHGPVGHQDAAGKLVAERLHTGDGAGFCHEALTQPMGRWNRLYRLILPHSGPVFMGGTDHRLFFYATLWPTDDRRRCSV